MKKNSKYFFILALIFISIFSLSAQRYYWVGDGDRTSWSDVQNWSSTSGGLGGVGGGINVAPTSSHTVVFDQNSKLINTGTVANQRNVITSGVVFCDSLIVQNCTTATLPVFYNISGQTGGISIYGSLFLQDGVTFRNYARFNFNSVRAQETIDINNVNLFENIDWLTTYNYAHSTFNGSAIYRLVRNTNGFASIIISVCPQSLNISGF